MPLQRVAIRHSYILDVANFLSVLTGDPFYVEQHPGPYQRWSTRLSHSAQEAVRGAVALWGSPMVGPTISYALSTIPGFAEMDLAEILTHLGTVDQRLRALPDRSDDFVRKVHDLCRTLSPVAEELESLGFSAYWSAERLPLITAATEAMTGFLSDLPFDIGEAVSHMLGDQDRLRDHSMELYLCTFAAPHGIRIYGDRFISDVRYKPQVTLRIAIHEMFHPPYRLQEVERETTALLEDPCSRSHFAPKIPSTGTTRN